MSLLSRLRRKSSAPLPAAPEAPAHVEELPSALPAPPHPPAQLLVVEGSVEIRESLHPKAGLTIPLREVRADGTRGAYDTMVVLFPRPGATPRQLLMFKRFCAIVMGNLYTPQVGIQDLVRQLERAVLWGYMADGKVSDIVERAPVNREQAAELEQQWLRAEAAALAPPSMRSFSGSQKMRA